MEIETETEKLEWELKKAPEVNKITARRGLRLLARS